MEATPLQNTSASTIALAFLNTWISRFGVPLHVVTDRGSQFESELFKDLSTIIGFHRLRTTAYHPQTNGIIERVHRTLKTAIMARKQSWLDALPIVLLGIRNMPNDQGFSPAAAVTGTQLLLPKLIMDKEDPDLHGDDIRKIAKEMRKLDMALLSEGQLHTTQKAFIPEDLKSATYVWLRTDRIRKPLEAPYSGPHRVVQKQNKYFQIETPSGEKQTVSIERLKPVKFRGANNNGNTGSKNTKRWTANNNTSEDTASQTQDTPEEPTVTRSGRRVRFAKHNDHIYYT